MITKVQMTPAGPHFSKLVQGYWRMAQWNLSTQACLSFIKTHVEMGITTVDHAHVYGNPSCEILFGNALKLDPLLRDKLEIVSKCGITPATEGKITHYNSSKQTIINSVELSLSRLGIECLDVLLIHRPDYLMTAEDIVETFLALKKQGKVNHLGVSNFNVAQLELLQSRIDTPLVTNQIEINPINLSVLESGMQEKLQQLNIRPMAWSCLAGGQLFESKSTNIERLTLELKAVGNEIGAESIDQVVFAWIMKLPSNPVPIIGSGNIDRVKKIAESLQLSMTHEQWYRILTASQGHGVA